MAEDFKKPPQARLPGGARLAVVFLDVTAAFLAFPVMISAFGALIYIIAGEALTSNQNDLVLGCLVFVCGFCGLLATMLGANWLVKLIRAHHAAGVEPRHPVRMIGIPVLNSCLFYCVVAMIVWLVKKFGGIGTPTWLWAGCFGGLGMACGFGLRVIRTRCPE